MDTDGVGRRRGRHRQEDVARVLGRDRGALVVNAAARAW